MLNLVQLSTNHATLVDLDSLLYSFVYEMHNHNPLTIILCMLTLKEKIEKKKRKKFPLFPISGIFIFFILSLHPQCSIGGPSPVGVCILTTMHGFYPFIHTHTHTKRKIYEGKDIRRKEKVVEKDNINDEYFLGAVWGRQPKQILRQG